MNNSPLPISDDEWNELAAHPVVRDNWYLNDTDQGDTLSERVYGAKFDYEYDVSPFERTDLYVLVAWVGAGANGDANNVVVMLCRDAEENGGGLIPIVLPLPENIR